MSSRYIFSCIVILLILCTASGFGQDSPEDKSLPIPDDLKEKVQQSIKLGCVLYLLDKASAMGTDALFEELGSQDVKGLGGYLTFQEESETGKSSLSWVVVFFTDEPVPRIAYRINISFEPGETPEVKPLNPPVSPNETLLALIRARQNAIKAAGPFRQPINPVVLPADIIDEKGILVELLAATTEPNVAVLGKHFRVIVSEDGNEVIKVTPLSNGWLELPTTSEELVKPMGLYATHLVTDYPVETHVFTGLLHKVPIYVKTARGFWLVDGGEITMIPEPTLMKNKLKIEKTEKNGDSIPDLKD